jgi:hypothetical protein
MRRWPSLSFAPRDVIRLRRAGAAALVAATAAALSACQVTVRTGINANRDGSGSVAVTAQLDHEAAQAVPDLGQQLQTSDLVKAGWRIDGPKPGPGHGVLVTASKAFANPTQARQVITELSGANGPFHDFHLTRHRSFFTTRTAFQGRVDLTCGLACFGDTGLQQQLGPDLGLDPARLQKDAGIILDRLFKFEVQVRLPGSLQSSNAPSQAGNGAQWRPRLGDQATLTATARAWNGPQLALLGIVVLLVLAAAALAVVRLRRRRRWVFR